MATKRHTTPSAAPVAATPEAAWNAASDLPRQQLSLATESACAMFRGFEAMRKIQERAAHQALQLVFSRVRCPGRRRQGDQDPAPAGLQVVQVIVDNPADLLG